MQREERITDTTMIANGACFEKAVLLAGKEGFLDRIGIHFNLTEGIPLTDGIRSIPDFVCGGAFCKAYVRDPRPLSEEEQNAVYAELTAQADRVVNAGICITHADSHHHVHTGLSVRVHDRTFDEDCVYHIVGVPQANPAEDKISDESPIGKGLIGHKVGDVITVEIPNGYDEMEILEIFKA